MRLEHDVAWLWEERPESSNMCLKGKEVNGKSHMIAKYML